jgi:hypothetical protein
MAFEWRLYSVFAAQRVEKGQIGSQVTPRRELS